uniref:Thiolase_N domain-containing protein n=1 Tax=Bursaphelenchus xylophilus TaxID=6326 RepID=A0A1I7RUS2_BURXY
MLRRISIIPTSFPNGVSRQLSRTIKRFASNRHVVVPNYPLHKKPGKTVSIEVAQPSDFGIFEKYCKTLYHAEPLTIAFVVEHYAKLHGVTEKKMKTALGIACYASDVVPNFMPKMERYVLGHGVLASVAKEYTGNGITSVLLIATARQMAADRICNYVYGNATATETARVGEKKGAGEVWRLNYDDIKVDGEFPLRKREGKAGLGAITGNFGLVQDIAKYDYMKRK